MDILPDGWLVFITIIWTLWSLLTIFYRELPWHIPGDTIMDIDTKFGSMLDGVQWEYHLSKANTSKTIHDQLLTIHYVFAIREYDFGAKTRTLERLLIPLMRGGLAWFRVSFGELPARDQSHELIVEPL